MNAFNLRTSSGLLETGTGSYSRAARQSRQKLAGFASALQSQLNHLQGQTAAVSQASPASCEGSAIRSPSPAYAVHGQDMLPESLTGAAEPPAEEVCPLTKKEILESLSEDARRTLGRIKIAPSSVDEDEWNNLMDELWHLGVITREEHLISRPGTTLIPLVTYDNGKSWHFAIIPQEIQQEMDAAKQWSCGPLEYLDQWMESLKKWHSWLYDDLSRSKDPVYEGLSVIESQIEGHAHISQIVRELIA